MQHIDDLMSTMESVLLRHETDVWVERFEQAGVPAGPVKTMTQVLENPQVLVRDMVIEVEHPIAGQVKALGFPIKFSSSSGLTKRGSPLFGEHTREILVELGYSPAAIQSLADQGVIHVGDTMTCASGEY